MSSRIVVTASVVPAAFIASIYLVLLSYTEFIVLIKRSVVRSSSSMSSLNPCFLKEAAFRS